MGKENVPRLTLTVEEARQMLGLSRGAMYQAVKSGQVPAIKIGRRLLIPKAAFEKMLSAASSTMSNGSARVQPRGPP